MLTGDFHVMAMASGRLGYQSDLSNRYNHNSSIVLALKQTVIMGFELESAQA